MAFDLPVARRRGLARVGLAVVCVVVVLALLAVVPAHPARWDVNVRQEPGAVAADFLDVVGVSAAGCEFFEVSRHRDRKGRRLIVFAESSRPGSRCEVDILSVTVDGGSVFLEIQKKADAAR